MYAAIRAGKNVSCGKKPGTDVMIFKMFISNITVGDNICVSDSKQSQIMQNFDRNTGL
jgi:hypothetical protein